MVKTAHTQQAYDWGEARLERQRRLAEPLPFLILSERVPASADRGALR